MRLSIVIPALNEAVRITEAVQRALALATADLCVVEVIVVDGGSNDGTPALASQAGAKALVSPPSRGGQLCAGAHAATGDTVLMLHADNWLEPDAGRQLYEVLRDPRVESGAFRQRIDADGFRYRLLEWGNAMRARWLGFPYGDQAIFVRRDVLEQVGGVPNLRLMEDVALMRKLRRRRYPQLLDGPLHVSARRWQQVGVVRQTLHNWGFVIAFMLGVSTDRLDSWYTLNHRNGRDVP